MGVLRDFNYRHGLKILLVIVPVIVWDVFFWAIKTVYNVCETIDEEGGRAIQKFLEK